MSILKTLIIFVVGLFLFLAGDRWIDGGHSIAGTFAVIIGLGLALFAGNRGYVPRSCGHGMITQGKLGIRYPWIVKKCPICGDISE